jgi:hypothetical protein
VEESIGLKFEKPPNTLTVENLYFNPHEFPNTTINVQHPIQRSIYIIIFIFLVIKKYLLGKVLEKPEIISDPGISQIYNALKK